MRRACRNGQTRCSSRSRKLSANLKLERESGWNRRTPAPNGAEHGRSSGNQEPSPHHRTFLRFRSGSTIAKDTIRGRIEGPDLDTVIMDVSASSVDNLCTYSSIKRTNVTMIWTARLCTTFTVAVQSASDMNRVLAQIMYAFLQCGRCPQTIQRYRYDSTEARSTSRVLPTRCHRRYAFPLEGSC